MELLDYSEIILVIKVKFIYIFYYIREQRRITTYLIHFSIFEFFGVIHFIYGLFITLYADVDISYRTLQIVQVTND